MTELLVDSIAKEKHRLVGLHLGVGDADADADAQSGWIDYDLGMIAVCALEALQTAVLAIEQIVTGERLVNSLDIGDFYNHLREALAEENGQGVMSEAGSMSSLQDEIQGLINLLNKARRIARAPKGTKKLNADARAKVRGE